MAYMPSIEKYKGMSYEQASREGARLVKQADRTGDWFSLIEPLLELRSVMRIRSAPADHRIGCNLN